MRSVLFSHWLIIIFPMAFILASALTSSSHLSSIRNNQQAVSQTKFHVAPMQGYTNAPFRHLMRLLSPDAILWTEMEKIQHLNGCSEQGILKRLPVRETGLVLQVGGSDAAAMKQCFSRLGNDFGCHFSEINLNCGCPSIEAGGADFGASLMKQPDITQRCFKAIAESTGTTTMLSLKCRTAVLKTAEELQTVLSLPQKHREIWNEQQFQHLCKYLEHARDGGISHVVLHARPAVLTGLSPTKNRLVPPLDYETVYKIALEFPCLQVTMNGGISNLEILNQHVQQGNNRRINSFMAGRWMMRRPLDLALIDEKFLQQEDNGSISSFVSVLDQYMQFVHKGVSQRMYTLSELCLPLYLIVEQLREDFTMDLYRNDCGNGAFQFPLKAFYTKEDEEAMYEIMKDALEELAQSIPGHKVNKKSALPEHVNWKRLSAFFKALVGTKVYSKWKRNRNELGKTTIS